MQGHGRIIAPDFCVAHREANSGLSTLNRTKSILSIYHQQRQLQKQRGMCLNDTYPFCQQPLSGNCHSICFSKPVLWTTITFRGVFLWSCCDLFCKRRAACSPITWNTMSRIRSRVSHPPAAWRGRGPCISLVRAGRARPRQGPCSAGTLECRTLGTHAALTLPSLGTQCPAPGPGCRTR